MAAAFCGSCGTKLAGTFCSICGAAAGQAHHQESPGLSSAQRRVDLGPTLGGFFDAFFKPRAVGESQAASIEQAPGNSISPELLARWNWGAFLLPVLWPFWHGMERLGIVMVICLLPFLWPVGLGIAIYLGLKGNQLAAQGRVYGTDEDFLRVEKAWTMWGAVSVVSTVVLYMLHVIGSMLTGAM